MSLLLELSSPTLPPFETDVRPGTSLVVVEVLGLGLETTDEDKVGGR